MTIGAARATSAATTKKLQNGEARMARLNDVMCKSIGALALALMAFATPAKAATTISNVKIAFLMPDEGSTRYEEQDRPGFVAEVKKLCPTCIVLYQNADADASRQQ